VAGAAHPSGKLKERDAGRLALEGWPAPLIHPAS
jgi:hypothetical protein